MISILKDERGFSLLEVIATTIIIAFAMASLFMGVLYAEKQIQRDYHDRVAVLLASGEADWQYYYLKANHTFDLYTSSTVTIDKLPRGRLLSGVMSVRRVDTYESDFGNIIPYSAVEVSVSWLEPGDRVTRRTVVREDFFNSTGSGN